MPPARSGSSLENASGDFSPNAITGASSVSSANRSCPSRYLIPVPTACICRLPDVTTSEGDTSSPDLSSVQPSVDDVMGRKVSQSASGNRVGGLPNQQKFP